MKNTADFEISTIIYIVLAVVAAIASAFQKKNQQEQKDVHPKTDEETGSFDQEYERSQNTSIPQPAIISQNEKDFRSKSMETYIESEAFLNTSYEYTDEIKASEIGGMDEKGKKVQINIDLKKAIIYSEIIHRKY